MQLSLQLNYSNLDYILYLDNLFVSKNLIIAFREHSISITGITRKNTKGIPRDLLQLKQNNTDLIWESILNKVINGVHFIL
jgi:hypothetical protein